MAHGQITSSIGANRLQPAVLNDQGDVLEICTANVSQQPEGKRPRGSRKQQAARKSARLQAIGPEHEHSVPQKPLVRRAQAPHSPLKSNIGECRRVCASMVPSALSSADLIEAPKPPPIIPETSTAPQKRKRRREQGPAQSLPERDRPHSKRQQSSFPSPTANGERLSEATSDNRESSTDPLEYWIYNGKWRREDFEQDNQVRYDFERGKAPEEFEQRDWLQEHCLKEPVKPMHGFHHLQHLLARKRSSSSLRRKSSGSNLQTPSDQLPREVKSAQYRNPDYAIALGNKGSYMREYDDDDIPENMRLLCQTLLETEQTVPRDSLFRDDLFKKTCRDLQDRNEAMVIRDIGLLIVPSAQTLAKYGATHLNLLYESVNEGWNSAIPFHYNRPQPDYSVGFDRSAFTELQLKKLEPFVGEIGSRITTYFMATTRIFFPFLTCEAKCGAAALDVADRQNAHSMTVAVKGIVELFKAVKREKELHQEILAFSISHDHRSVRIYGHYAIIEEDKTTFYRHPIHDFSFTALDGKEKWTSYKFTKNIYDIWMPIQHKRICSAIDELPPDIDFDLSQSASFSQSGPQKSEQSDAESVGMLEESDSLSSIDQRYQDYHYEPGAGPSHCRKKVLDDSFSLLLISKFPA